MINSKPSQKILNSLIWCKLFEDLQKKQQPPKIDHFHSGTKKVIHCKLITEIDDPFGTFQRVLDKII